MKTPTQESLPARSLIHDEVEEIASKSGKLYPFRIRIWRAADVPAVVLVGQVEGGPPPSWLSIKLANHCLALCGHPAKGMAYFEDCDQAEGKRRLSQVHFDRFGCGLRGRLYNPLPQGRTRGFLESLVGRPIEW